MFAGLWLGRDDCRLYCPWNRFPHYAQEHLFRVRHELDRASLLELSSWDEETFRAKSESAVLRRLGHNRWLRNLAVGLGNAESHAAVVSALRARQNRPSPLVREHVRRTSARRPAQGSSGGQGDSRKPDAGRG